MIRIKASLTHFLVSVFVVSTALLVVFFLWFPSPYNETNDIWALVKILILVDLILGPFITLIIFNTKKPIRTLKRDLAIIASIQLSALGYGLYSMYMQRPDYLVFGVDRFEVMSAIDVDKSPLGKDLPPKPLAGPLVVYAETGKTPEMKKRLFEEWLAGKGDFTTRREFYRPVADNIDEIVNASLDIDEVIALPGNVSKKDVIRDLLNHAKTNNGQSIYLPIQGKTSMVVAFNNTTGAIGEVFDLYPWVGRKKAAAKAISEPLDDEHMENESASVDEN